MVLTQYVIKNDSPISLALMAAFLSDIPCLLHLSPKRKVSCRYQSFLDLQRWCNAALHLFLLVGLDRKR